MITHLPTPDALPLCESVMPTPQGAVTSTHPEDVTCWLCATIAGIDLGEVDQ